MSRRELFGSLCAMVFLVNLARVVFAPCSSLSRPTSGSRPPRWGSSRAPRGSVAPPRACRRASSRPGAPPPHRRRDGGVTVVTASFTAVAGSVGHLTAGAFLMGLSSGVYFVVANPLVGDLFPERVGRFVGLHGMAAQLASVSAPLAVGAILLHADWRVTFLGVAVVAAVATTVSVVAARRTSLPDAAVGNRSLLVAGRAQWPIILAGVAFIGTAGFLWNGLFNLYGDFLTVSKGIDPATGRLAETLPNVPLLVGVVGVFVSAVFSRARAEGVLPLAVASFVAGHAFFSMPPTLDTYLLTTLPDRHRGSAYAIYSASMMVLQALGSGTVGLAVVSGATYTVVFRTVAVAVGGVAVALYLLYRAGRLPRGGRTPPSVGQ